MNNDLISRSVLKKAIINNFDNLQAYFPKDFIEEIDNAPTVDMNTELSVAYLKGRRQGQSDVRPQGEWIMQRHDLDGCFYTCSNCGRMIRVPLFIDDPEDNETLADYPFCHCGAKMKGGAELYREETCKSKDSCDDYKYWHCVGCNGCKKGGKE